MNFSGLGMDGRGGGAAAVVVWSSLRMKRIRSSPPATSVRSEGEYLPFSRTSSPVDSTHVNASKPLLIGITCWIRLWTDPAKGPSPVADLKGEYIESPPK